MLEKKEGREFVKEKGKTFDGSFVALDIETTGFDAENDYIIEIGAVKIVNGAIVDRFSTFVAPGAVIPEKIVKLTSITNKMVAEAPLIAEVLPSFLKFCEESVLVAHNVKFDMAFIRQKAKDLGIEVDATCVDTSEMARKVLPKLENFKLVNVAKSLDIPLENIHRSVDSAECTARIFLKMMMMLEKQGIRDLSIIEALG